MKSTHTLPAAYLYDVGNHKCHSKASESMCTKYWLTACSSLPRKKVRLGELSIPLTWDVNQRNKTK